MFGLPYKYCKQRDNRPSPMDQMFPNRIDAQILWSLN